MAKKLLLEYSEEFSEISTELVSTTCGFLVTFATIGCSILCALPLVLSNIISKRIK
jgi:hypothetical protein